MKKLGLFFVVSVFWSTLFAATAEDDQVVPCTPRRGIKRPATTDARSDLITRSITWSMAGLTEAENKDHLAAPLLMMKNHTRIRIAQVKPLLLDQALTHLNLIEFKFVHLTHLDLPINNITVPLLEKISQLAPNLRSLNVSHCFLEADHAKAISRMNQLTTLNLWDNDLKDEGAYFISLMLHLKTLGVGNNGITDKGAGYISQLPNLENLDISCNQVGPGGATSLSSQTSLKSLNVGHNEMGDEGAQFLSKMHWLKCVDFEYNGIGEAPVRLLRQSLSLTYILSSVQ